MKWIIPLLLFSAGCSQITNPNPVIPSGSTTPSTIVDTIEFRVFGDIGQSTAVVKYQDSVNGVTILTSESLPYLARIKSTESSIFLFIEATAVPIVQLYTSPAVLQVQIVVNGIVFREGFATGFTNLTATASGTYHH